MIRSDNDAGRLADELRSQMAVVSTLPGFVRERSEYTITPDGLGLSYTVVDKEVFNMPPQGAYEADGDFEQSSTRGGGQRYASCRCRLKGAKFIAQSRLAQLAAGVVFSTLYAKGFGQINLKTFAATGVKLESATFKLWLYDNMVEVSARVMKPAPAQRIGPTGLDLVADVGDKPPKGSDDDRLGPMPQYFDRGSSDVLLRAAAYWDNTIKASTLGPAGPFAGDNPQTTHGGDKVDNVPGKAIGTAGIDPG